MGAGQPIAIARALPISAAAWVRYMAEARMNALQRQGARRGKVRRRRARAGCRALTSEARSTSTMPSPVVTAQ
jgi:hypothetical protein